MLWLIFKIRPPTAAITAGGEAPCTPLHCRQQTNFIRKQRLVKSEERAKQRNREKQRLKAGGHDPEPDTVVPIDWSVPVPVGAAHAEVIVVERTPAQRPGVAAFWTLRIVFW